MSADECGVSVPAIARRVLLDARLRNLYVVDPCVVDHSDHSNHRLHAVPPF